MSDPFNDGNPFDDKHAPLVSRDYNPDRWREGIRGAVTLTAMLIFAIIIFRYFNASLMAATDDQWSRVKEATEVILPAVTSILGSAIGFYFGSQQKK